MRHPDPLTDQCDRVMPRRISPGLCWIRSEDRECEDRSCHGTLVTITPGSNSSRALSRSELWLCSRFSHQRPTTYSGM